MKCNVENMHNKYMNIYDQNKDLYFAPLKMKNGLVYFYIVFPVYVMLFVNNEPHFTTNCMDIPVHSTNS